MNFITRPSSLPAQAVSPRFQPAGEGNKATVMGTDRHAALEALFKGDTTLLLTLPDNEITAVRWAYDLVKTLADMHSIPVETEVQLSINRHGVQIMQGTVDVIVGDNLFDMKWYEADYEHQMAAYAIALMNRNKTSEATVHIMFAATQRVWSYTISYADACNMVYGVVDAVANPTTVCKPSKYCKRCKHELTCDVLTKNINQVADTYAMVPAEQLPVATPEKLASALNLAKVASQWAKAVEEFAKEAAMNGVQIPGYELKERAGNRKIESHRINDAYAALGIPHQEFMAACSVTIGDLEKALARTRNITLTQARQEFDTRLASIITQAPSTLILSKSK
jgi:CRISPR/Cas system-associated exonuclease Cas4 (RecB family)